MNKGTKNKFPRCDLALKEFDGTHQSMREAWRAIKLDKELNI